MRRTRPLSVVLLAAALSLVAAGCGGSEGSSDDTTGSGGTDAAGTSTPATTTPPPLRILVTNDDGVGADGIDAVVEGLRRLPGVEVVVVAPATNQSGTASKVTDGPLTATDASTKSGYPAKAVQGFPADTIVWALDQGGIDVRPDLVVSGINAGQNIGAAVELSGTVGAARAAVSRGIPALASSQGTPVEGGTFDFPTGVEHVVGWVAEHRDQLQTTSVANLNVPTCNGVGAPKALTTVAVGSELSLVAQDCRSTLTAPVDDVQAFVNGFVTLSEVSPTPKG
jgi:5'-nucleotidase